MSSAQSLEDEGVKLGLLLETAHSQQELVASELAQLQAHTRGLDDIVRAQIRRTLMEELAGLGDESERAVTALRALERSGRLRMLGLTLAMVLLSAAICTASAWWLLPTPAQLAALRAQRDQMRVEIEALAQHAGRIDLRHCGTTQRWCVRVDRRAPAYGEDADYWILKGY